MSLALRGYDRWLESGNPEDEQEPRCECGHSQDSHYFLFLHNEEGFEFLEGRCARVGCRCDSFVAEEGF